MSGEVIKFPEGFYWGAATSAHQVEGGNRNDWSEWELESSKLKVKSAKLREWPDYIFKNYPNPLQEENYISGRACDHYNRFREDFDIAKRLGHNAHRFSIEWSRVEPEEGKFDEAAIEHYRQVIAALRERGMEPFVTLWHYTLPQWFARRGGWLHPRAVTDFSRYAKRVTAEYGREVRFWITKNEPETFVRHAYLVGDRPPQQRNIFTTYRVLRRLLAAHRAAYDALKSKDPTAQVGFAETKVYFEPYRRLPHHMLTMKAVKWWRNNPLYRDFAARSDFIGLEYYFHSRIRLNPFTSRWAIQDNEDREVSDLGWEIYPQGLYHVLDELRSYRKPIYIVENGVADAADNQRASFIRRHVEAVARALHEGIDVRGYFYWSLLDNFEWQLGFWPRFGLVEVDYTTLERKIRPSAWEYKKIIEANAVERG